MNACLRGLVVGIAVLAAWSQGGVAVAAEEGKTPATKAAPKPDAKQVTEFDEGVALFRNQDFEGAMERFKAAVAKDPGLPKPNVIMAQLFLQTNRLLDARMWLERAVRESPGDPEPYVLFGETALQEKRFTEADLVFRKANGYLRSLTSRPARAPILSPRCLAGLAAVAEQREDWASAEEYLRDATAEGTPSTELLRRLAGALLKQKKSDEALAAAKKVVEQDPQSANAHAVLGRIHHSQGNLEEAGRLMDEAVKAASNHAPTLRAAAQFALETEKYQRAVELSTAVVAADPKSWEGRVLRGLAALAMKDYPVAEKEFQEAVAQAPGNPMACNGLALALCEQADPQRGRRAMDYAQLNARLFPRESVALATLARVHYKQGRVDEAEQILRGVVGKDTPCPEGMYYLARILADRGKTDDARKLLDAALKIPPPFILRQDAQKLRNELK